MTEGDKAIDEIIKRLNKIPPIVETRTINNNIVDDISDAILKKLRRKISI